MSARSKKFENLYKRINEIEEAVNTMGKRIDLGNSGLSSLKKEYAKLTKQGNALCEKMSEAEFDTLGDMCMEYDEFVEGIFEEELYY